VRFRLAEHLLDDPRRAVRIEAGRLLASTPSASLDLGQSTLLTKAVGEYITSQRGNADRPQAQVNLGNLYARMGEAGQAEAAYGEALLLDKRFVPAYTNLADLYRQTGREADARESLEQGLTVAPDQGALHHAYGLALVRTKELDRAVDTLARAIELVPDNARYAYVHAVALEAAGDLAGAIEALERAHALHEYDPRILSALVDYAGRAGEMTKANAYETRLVELQRKAASALGVGGSFLGPKENAE
jgi:Flp pilus assembly protein TadD